MGTLASELGPHAGRIAGQPRLYVDANVPAGLVSFMRVRLQWDVLFVVEHDDLRRSSDGEHYRRARESGRTLITFDRDYLDDRRFPPRDSGGVVVLTAPDDRGCRALLERLDAFVFRAGPHPPDGGLPLDGRKLHVHVDWGGRWGDREPGACPLSSVQWSARRARLQPRRRRAVKARPTSTDD